MFYDYGNIDVGKLECARLQKNVYLNIYIPIGLLLLANNVITQTTKLLF